MFTRHPEHHAAWTSAHRAGTGTGDSRGLGGVLALSVVTMVTELVAGWWTGSLALLADGWHMASHVVALGLAYAIHRAATSPGVVARLTHGPGKLRALGGYSSAILLGGTSLWMTWSSALRLAEPSTIDTGPALVVAGIGLLVNLVSARLLHHDHDDHEGDHDHDHAHDPNHAAALAHVLADALTSVFAILALAASRWWGWHIADPLMGIVGAGVVLVWAVKLVRATAPLLLDVAPARLLADMRTALGTALDGEVIDIHVWSIAPECRYASVVLVAHRETTADDVRRVLAPFGLAHVTVEITPCSEAHS